MAQVEVAGQWQDFPVFFDRKSGHINQIKTTDQTSLDAEILRLLNQPSRIILELLDSFSLETVQRAI